MQMNDEIAAIAYFDPNASSNPGKISGTVKFFQESPNQPTLVQIKLSAVPRGVHGIHIHRLGDLTRGCDSTCQHWNPQDRMHGSQQLTGSDRHAGDLSNNIEANYQSIVDYTYWDELIDLSGPYSIIGRSVVIHDKKDDLGLYRNEDSERGRESATTGNAGKRIACAIIGITDYPTNSHCK